MGQLVSATITNVNEHGVLCQLENGVKGLATMEHIEGLLTTMISLNLICLLEPDSVHKGSGDARHEKTDLKVFVVVLPKEGWARILLLV